MKTENEIIKKPRLTKEERAKIKIKEEIKAELGNDSYKTATDRFNINDHQKTNEQLVNIQPIVPEIINFD